MGDRRYQLKGLTEAHMQSLLQALDFMNRMGMGQFRELFDLVDSEFKANKTERDEAEKLLFRARSIMMPGLNGPNNYHSIRSPTIKDTYRVLYDMQQVIRHRLAWDRKPKGDFTVDFDEPWRTSETLGLIEVVSEEVEQLPPPPEEIIIEEAPKKASKKKYDKSSRTMQRALCTEKIACDGNPLYRDRKICSKCEEALAKKNREKAKKEPVLKGVPSRTNKRRTASP